MQRELDSTVSALTACILSGPWGRGTWRLVADFEDNGSERRLVAFSWREADEPSYGPRHLASSSGPQEALARERAEAGSRLLQARQPGGDTAPDAGQVP